MGLRRIRGTASRSPGSASGRLSPERAIIFVLRSRKLLLLVLRLRSVLHTLVGMVMRMLVYVLPLLAGRPLMFRRQCAAALRDGGNRRIWTRLAKPETRNPPTTILVVLILLPPAQRSPKRRPTVLGGKAGRHPSGISRRTCSLRSEPADQHGQIQHAPGLASEARVYRTIAQAPFGRDVVKNHGEVVGRLAWLSKAACHPPIMKRAPIAEESAFSRARVSRRPSRGQLLRSNFVAPRSDEYGRSAARSGNPGNVG